MKWLNWTKWPLAARLTLIMTGMVVFSVTGTTALSLGREQATSQAELEQQAVLVLTTLEQVATSTRTASDTRHLDELIQELTDTDLLIASGIYDQTGTLIAGSHLEAALAQQADQEAWDQQLISSHASSLDYYKWLPDRLLAARIITPENAPSGAVHIELSTAPLNARMAATRTQGMVFIFITILFGSFAATLISRSITEPLALLKKAAERISAGDLSYRITLTDGPEVTVLAETFNRMSDDIQQIVGNLEQWVEERTEALTSMNNILREEVAEHLRAEMEVESQNQLLQKANAELLEVRDQTLAALRLKTQILANVSHDARTPISVIMLRAQMLQQGRYGTVTDVQHEKLESIILNARQLLGFIDNLLGQARSENAEFKLHEADISPAELLKDIDETLQPLAEKKGLQLVHEISRDVPPTLYVDPDRFSQILANLVNNAIKFTAHGTVSVKICCPDEDHWALYVTDTGPGIAPEDQAHIFDAFWQADGSLTRDTNRGIGLGLSIVNQLTGLMGGTVSLQSVVGQGSTFIVSFPLKAVQATQEDTTCAGG